jgi:uncharacterized protein (DUF4415 family)
MIENAKNTKATWCDDAPELTDDFFERAEIRDGEKLIRPANGTLTKRGRPKLDNPKQQVTIRLDSDVIDRLRNSGPGWQSRINDILRKAVGA